MKSTAKLKIIPGRGLSGRDIKARLRNRTIEGQIFGPDAYLLDEQMGTFMKMNKVERINAIKENNKKIQEMQSKLDATTNAKKKAEEEQKIEREIKARMEKLAKEQIQKQTQQ